jgi:predicted RNA polymerase sigma factor
MWGQPVGGGGGGIYQTGEWSLLHQASVACDHFLLSDNSLSLPFVCIHPSIKDTLKIIVETVFN